MLSCNDCLARHSDYLDDRLDRETAAQVRAHLKVCARCARRDRVLRQGLKLLAELPQIEPAPDFTYRLQQRIEAEHVRSAFMPIRYLTVASLAVAAMLALAAWVPVLMMSMREAVVDTVQAAESSPVASEIAWHGAHAVDESSHQDIHLVARSGWKPEAEEHVIAPRYTPVVVESPTAPITYSPALYAE